MTPVLRNSYLKFILSSQTRRNAGYITQPTTQRSTINSASTTTAPISWMPHTSADNRSRLTADLYRKAGKDSRDVHH